MNVSPGSILLLFLFHSIAAAACTAWYARRPSVHTAGSALLVIFAWLIPFLGVMCLLVFLISSKGSRTSERQVSPPASPL